MKFFVAITLFAAVASASAIKPSSSNAAAIIQQILENIASLKPEGPSGIAVGPAIVDSASPGVPLEPAWIDFPMPDGGAISAPMPPVPISQVTEEIIPTGTPLVQIILKINKTPLLPVPSPIIKPDPVHIVESENPDSAIPPVIVMPVHPIGISPPQPVEPVIVGTPVLPSPAVVLPEEIN